MADDGPLPDPPPPPKCAICGKTDCPGHQQTTD